MTLQLQGHLDSYSIAAIGGTVFSQTPRLPSRSAVECRSLTFLKLREFLVEQ